MQLYHREQWLTSSAMQMERKEAFIKYSAHKQQTELSWEWAYTFQKKVYLMN